MATDLTLRLTKGSQLTAQELDDNFTALDSSIFNSIIQPGTTGGRAAVWDNTNSYWEQTAHLQVNGGAAPNIKVGSGTFLSSPAADEYGLTCTAGNYNVDSNGDHMWYFDEARTGIPPMTLRVSDGQLVTASGIVSATGLTSFGTLVALGNIAGFSDLAISGDITASGNITALSDIRTKTDISVIENPLDIISAMDGIKYTDIKTGQRRTGVIAQEVIKVLPEVVVQTEDSDGGKLGVAYGNIAGVIIESIKELKSQIEDLQEEIDKLQGQR